jgi:hypothetical protein
MYLDYAEMQAERQKPVYMREWREKLDAFLKFNEQEILEDRGSCSMEVARALALSEYEKYSARRIAEESEAPDPEFEQAAKQIEKKMQGQRSP